MVWMRTSWAAHRTRNWSLRVDSSPIRSDICRSYGSRPASARSKATTSLATLSQSRKNSTARASRKVNRALLGPAGSAYICEKRARPRALAPRTSCRALSTNAGVPNIESSTRCTVGRTCCRAARRRCGPTGPGGAEQVDKVRPFGVVELQSVRHAIDDALGDTSGGASLEADVVLDRDPGEERCFLAPQARDPPAPAAVDGQPGLLGGDPCPASGQELADLGADVATDVAGVRVCHGVDCTTADAGLGVPVSTPFTETPTLVQIVVGYIVRRRRRHVPHVLNSTCSTERSPSHD